jgi:hypothetical protein
MSYLITCGMNDDEQWFITLLLYNRGNKVLSKKGRGNQS